MNLRDILYREEEYQAIQSLRKGTLASFLKMAILVSATWIIINIFFFEPIYFWFAGLPLVYLLPAFIFNKRGKTSLAWHIVLLSSSLFITLSPIFFEPLVALLLILFVIYQQVSLGFISIRVKYFYILLIGSCFLSFILLCHFFPGDADKVKLLTSNLLISIVAIVFISLINKIQDKERQQARERLLRNKRLISQSEERYRTLFEASPAGIIIIDLNGKGALDCNEQMTSLFEAEKEEILRGSTLDFSPEFQPDGERSANKFIRLKNQFLKDKKPIYTEWEYRTKNNRPFFAEVTLTPIELDAQLLVVQQLQDITHKKESEEIIRKSEKRYQTLFENGYDGIIIFDLKNRRPQSCNQVTLDMLGITEEEFATFDFLKHAPKFQPNGQDSKSFIWHHIKKIKKEHKIRFEWLQYDKNGKSFFAEVSAFALPRPEEELAIVIFKNTTEKVITQRALETVSRPIIRGREHRFFDQLTYEVARFLQVDIVLVGKLHKDHKMMDAKGLWFRDKNIHGLSYPLEYTPCDQVVISKEMKCYPSRLKELFPLDKDLESWNVESYVAYPLFSAEKEMIGHFAIMDSKPMINEEIVHTTMKIFATTLASELEREEHELELQKSNDELRKVNAELDRFVYSAAHDIRAPISSVLGLINISEEQENIDVIRHYLKLQKASLKKLDLFITDLINYSINKRRSIANELIDIDALLDEVIDQYRYLENFNQIEITREISDPGPLFSDKNRLKLILNNLISNAIHYADLDKASPCINISIQIKADNASFSVWDNGQGIPEDQISKIFDMFHRANKHSKGSGIGLYITKEAVEKLGGSMTVTSALKEWTLFSFEVVNQQTSSEEPELSV